MSTYRLSRRGALGAAAVLPILGLRSARAQTLDKFSYQTNWRGEAEHGGFYQALAIAAVFQKDLRALLSHPGVGNDNLAALKGKPILIGAAAMPPRIKRRDGR